MKRRDVGRVLAAAVGGSTATLAGLRVASEDAAAQTAVALDIAGDSTTVGSDETVTALRLSVDVDWAYDLPSSAAPSTAIVEIAAATGDGELVVVDSAESAQLFTSSDGTESFDVELLSAGVASGADLTPESGSRETDVTIEARFRLEDSSGDVIARETVNDTAAVAVERESAPASEYGSVGGSGTLTIETA